MRVLVTGASGFVGRTVCRLLAATGHDVRAVSRSRQDATPGAVGDGSLAWYRIADPLAEPDWRVALDRVDAVVHLAARVHRLGEPDHAGAAACHAANVETTVALAAAAAATGVERFVFVSSAKVHGENSAPEAGGWHRYTEQDTPRPVDAYARSKWEAERALRTIATESRLPVVVVRPPLVYGPGVGANFLALVRAVLRGLPLPLAAIDNLRSLVSVENLGDLLTTVIAHPRAAGRTYLVRDLDLSTPDLVRAIAAAARVPVRLLYVPTGLLRACASLLRRRERIDRLLESFVVDASRAADELGWRPAIEPARALADTVQWYREHGLEATR